MYGQFKGLTPKNGLRLLLCLGVAVVGIAAAYPAQEGTGASHAGAVARSNTISAANHLAGQKSPYLLEHAHDPVDWYPWGPAAFAAAKRQNKLIFLSIGYSACHWCHVMQKEDFENPQVAALLNKSYIPVLVDREERPDIDNEYMAVCEMLTGGGGWPLLVILTPDRQPFFASTYIPRESSGGHVGMLELLPKIEMSWKSNPDKITRNGEKLSSALARALVQDSPGGAPGRNTLDEAYHQLASAFDGRHGGFGGAPKFPPDLDLLFLLRYWKRSGDARALSMVEKTLDAMREGGIFDQVGFGFHRYSTDADWHVPHFEKMLYDQALIALAYTEAYQATRQERFRKTAEETFTYVERVLTSSEGAFYDSEDADSAGGEGRFYLWTEEQIRQALSPAEADLVLKVFDTSRKGNFQEAGQGENILYFRTPLEKTAAEMKMTSSELQQRLGAAREKLFAARQKRQPPAVDTKILTSWNGLMIAALARAAQAFGDARYAQKAERAAGFILENLRSGDGRLLHSYAGGKAVVPANLDDYAFFIWGLTELYEADFQAHYLQAALDLSSQMVAHYWDAKNGGFFFTADDDRSRTVREKSMNDSDLPSGNSIAALDLLRLADMTGEAKLQDKAIATEQAFAGLIRKSPADFPAALSAADYSLGPRYEVVIAGDSRARDTRAMLRAATAPYLPDKVVLLRPTQETAPGILRLAGYTKYQTALGGKPTAYVCRRYQCKLPTTDSEKMLQLLGASSH